jgi:hypothetical protein
LKFNVQIDRYESNSQESGKSFTFLVKIICYFCFPGSSESQSDEVKTGLMSSDEESNSNSEEEEGICKLI